MRFDAPATTQESIATLPSGCAFAQRRSFQVIMFRNEEIHRNEANLHSVSEDAVEGCFYRGRNYRNDRGREQHRRHATVCNCSPGGHHRSSRDKSNHEHSVDAPGMELNRSAQNGIEYVHGAVSRVVLGDLRLSLVNSCNLGKCRLSTATLRIRRRPNLISLI